MCGSKPSVNKQDPAPPAPPPPQDTTRMKAATEATAGNKDTVAKRKGRSALKIDLQTGGNGTGLNVAQG